MSRCLFDNLSTLFHSQRVDGDWNKIYLILRNLTEVALYPCLSENRIFNAQTNLTAHADQRTFLDITFKREFIPKIYTLFWRYDVKCIVV